jgi:Na+-transporting methylmalonyl-CoA/oxaloacetate decarboxylase gamma subunit
MMARVLLALFVLAACVACSSCASKQKVMPPENPSSEVCAAQVCDEEGCKCAQVVE